VTRDNLRRMYPVLLSDLMKRFVLPQRFKGNPRFLFGAASLASHLLLLLSTP